MELRTEHGEPVAPRSPAPHRRQAAGGAGFTLVEVLIAAGLLMAIALGTLPLFMRSVIDIASGRESTEVANFARSKIEEYSQLDFNSAALTIDTGTEKVVTDYYSYAQKKWIEGPVPTDDPATFVRSVTVRQYNASALGDLQLDPGEALISGIDPGFVHLKEVIVAVRGTRRLAALGSAKRITLQMLKSQ